MGWVIGALSILGGLAWLVAALPPLQLLYISLAVVGLGVLLGIPFGLLYHLRLRTELLRLGELPRRWYLEPTKLHARLGDAALARVYPAFMLGALGFGLIMLGCTLATLTLFTHFA
ncbi:MAG: hypothetical protein QM778_29995 [Myxococcales bacterium]